MADQARAVVIAGGRPRRRDRVSPPAHARRRDGVLARRAHRVARVDRMADRAPRRTRGRRGRHARRRARPAADRSHRDARGRFDRYHDRRRHVALDGRDRHPADADRCGAARDPPVPAPHAQRSHRARGVRPEGDARVPADERREDARADRLGSHARRRARTRHRDRRWTRARARPAAALRCKEQGRDPAVRRRFQLGDASSSPTRRRTRPHRWA